MVTTLNNVARLFFRALMCAVFASLVAVAPAHANTIIDFKDSVLTGGTVSYDGSGGPLVGTDIVLQYVLGVNTPTENGAHDLTGAVLNFTTGALASTSGGTYSFSPGGTFEITGAVNDACAISGTLC